MGRARRIGDESNWSGAADALELHRGCTRWKSDARHYADAFWRSKEAAAREAGRG